METTSSQGDFGMVNKAVRFLKKNALAIVLGIVATGFVVNGVLLSTSNVGVTIKGNNNTVTVQPPEVPAYTCREGWAPDPEASEHGVVFACERADGWRYIQHEDGSFSHAWNTREANFRFVDTPSGVPGW